MRRRHILLASLPLAATTLTRPAMSQTATPQPPVMQVRTLDDALRWLDALQRSPQVTMRGQWPIGTVLNHLAQSIEMSLDGYPAPKSALFQATAGAAAFAFFQWRGRMSHGLAEPIPGAPALPMTADIQPGADRLRAAITRFQSHTGPLMPHFAYGKLDKAQYAAAHAMHVGNHGEEVG